MRKEGKKGKLTASEGNEMTKRNKGKIKKPCEVGIKTLAKRGKRKWRTRDGNLKDTKAERKVTRKRNRKEIKGVGRKQ